MDLRYKRGHIYDGTGKITGSDSGGLECGYKGDHIGDYLSGRSGSGFAGCLPDYHGN